MKFVTPDSQCSATATWHRLKLAVAVTRNDRVDCGACQAVALCFALYLGTAAGIVRADQPSPASPAQAQPVYFATDVVPLLSKLGCNSGGCHGKATGQNGFKLSLLGFEPDFDYDTVVKEARGRRVFPGAPERSLLLLKATGVVAHGGGRRMASGSEDAGVLARWIEQGALPSLSTDPVLERITVSPSRRVFDNGQSQQPLQVTAYLSDGTRRDVTRQVTYQLNEPDLADVSEDGVVTTKPRSGQFAVMIRHGEQIGVFYGTVPFRRIATTVGQAFQPDGATASADQAVKEPRKDPSKTASRTTAPAAPQPATFRWSAGVLEVDRHLAAQWAQLGVEPSPQASDAEFIRRVTLDICGTLPTVDEVQAYTGDVQPGKRARLIDRLLSRPEYASYFALKWADILQNRGAGYSTSRQRAGTALFAGWIRDSIASNMPYDRFASEILTAGGSQETNPPTVWYRTVRTTEGYVESVSQAFLGVRLQCAQCHHHPAERWSQSDYFGLAAVFARVGRKGGFADAEVPTSEIIHLAAAGEVVHPRTGQVVRPRPLGGPDFALTPYDDPRRKLAEWMTAPGNPYFARTMANRMWGHFFGRGIIHPIDDARSTNPPSNPELIDALARDFADSAFDVQHLIRVICNSRAYGLSSAPNDTNRDDVQSFARYYPRRLAAEVLLDALSQVLDAPSTFSGGPGKFPAGTRAIDLPDEAVPSHFLDVFGRPSRSSACECERVDAPALGQVLELVSSSEIQEKLSAPNAYPQKLAAGNGPPAGQGGTAAKGQAAGKVFEAGTVREADKIREMFLRVFARPPRPEELTIATRFVEQASDRAEAYRSLLWSLLVTNEFLMNH